MPTFNQFSQVSGCSLWSVLVILHPKYIVFWENAKNNQNVPKISLWFSNQQKHSIGIDMTVPSTTIYEYWVLEAGILRHYSIKLKSYHGFDLLVNPSFKKSKINVLWTSSGEKWNLIISLLGVHYQEGNQNLRIIFLLLVFKSIWLSILLYNEYQIIYYLPVSSLIL